MTSYTKLIDDTLFNNAVKELNNINKYTKIALRLQSIISSKKNNISQTAKFLGFDRTVIIPFPQLNTSFNPANTN